MRQGARVGKNTWVVSYNQTGRSFDVNFSNFRCNIGILIDRGFCELQ